MVAQSHASGEIFHLESDLFYRVVPEEIRDASRRDDEVIVRFLARIAVRTHVDRSALRIDAGDVAQQHAQILLPPEDAADRVGDVARIEPARRDLIEQWGKSMVVI